jgi:hypothetical protein
VVAWAWAWLSSTASSARARSKTDLRLDLAGGSSLQLLLPRSTLVRREERRERDWGNSFFVG